jgi:hypothetical protein
MTILGVRGWKTKALEKNLRRRFMTHIQGCSASKKEEEEEEEEVFVLYLQYEISYSFTALDEMARTWRILG